MENSFSAKKPGKIDDLSLSTQRAVARRGTRREFAELVEPYRRELQVHCYRMLGSLQDAEDLVQETLLRAWQKRSSYEGRAPLRAWLYQIATHACLNALAQRKRRRLPESAYPPSDPGAPFAPPQLEPVWLEPFPDEMLPDPSGSPESIYETRESVSLAFLAALQTLSPRQRAILLLCDVLEWQVSEVASLLETTGSAVNSALHRARITCAKLYRPPSDEATRVDADDQATRLLLTRYMHAWEASNIDELVSLLKQDASFAMPPSSSWYLGREAIRTIAEKVIAGPGRWRLMPVQANGTIGFGVYLLQKREEGYRPFGIQVLTTRDGQVASATTFLNPALFPFFHLPDQLPA